MKCKDCKYWYSWDEAGDYGYCRRMPHFEMKKSDNFTCGEFTSKEELTLANGAILS